MVGKQFSFWEGFLVGVLFVSGRVIPVKNNAGCMYQFDCSVFFLVVSENMSCLGVWKALHS